MPPESDRHAYTLMAFPGPGSIETKKQLKALQVEVAAIANTISRFEPVHLYARNDLISQAKSMVSSAVLVKPATVSELWIRDSGPVFVQDLSTGRRIAIKFNFNYWGKKLPFIGDENVAARIANSAGEHLVTSKLTLEGGGIEHDGEGTFLGTESCIMNKNRNRGFSKSDVEAELTRQVGSYAPHMGSRCKGFRHHRLSYRCTGTFHLTWCGMSQQAWTKRASHRREGVQHNSVNS